MADIDLQRKGPKWGRWILAALVAVLLIWAIVEVLGDDAPVAGDFDDPALVEPAPAPGAELTTPADAPAAVAEFRQRCVQTGTDTDDMGRQHQFTIDCLESMAAAMDAAIQADTVGSLALQERLATLRDRAAAVQRSEPSATSHAGTVAEAFDAGAELVDTYQQERGAAGDDYASDVREAADRLSPDQMLLEQRDAIHAYFQAMAGALERMST